MDFKIFTTNIDDVALEQIHELLNLGIFNNNKIRIMPDVHPGVGCVIGFTGNLGDKVIPNIVGVDIGCGMLTVELGKIDINLVKLDNFIKTQIPSGFDVYEKGYETNLDKYLDLKELYCYDYLNDKSRLKRSLGTLGGGNHFIEIDIDEDNNKYLVIHTGSRNLGKQVADYYQRLAINYCKGVSKEERQELIDKLKAENRHKEISIKIHELEEKRRSVNIPNHLCFLEGENREKYLHDMKLCQYFASLNRKIIAMKIIHFLGINDLGNNFETIHNYIDDENMVRKGAISARKGEKVLIPINMRDGCIIGIGKGNEDWNYSAPHGAGRVMSRREAINNINMKEFIDSMKGIYTTTANINTIDEAPMVYKPIDEIINNICDTVEIVKIIKPIYNFKGF